MEDIRTPGVPGQNPYPSTHTDVVDVVQKLRALQRDLGHNLPRICAAAVRLEAKVRALASEPQGEGEAALSTMASQLRELLRAADDLGEEANNERAAPDGDQEPPEVPALALRSDGKTLLSIVHLGDMDLSTRERWEGIVLTEAEALDVLNRVSGACEDAAGHIAGRMVVKDKARDHDSGEGDDE